jgi:chlorite dismutase
MSVTANTGISVESLPPVPLTVEGSSVLHQMFRVRWTDWKKAPEDRRQVVIAEAAEALGAMENNESGQTGLFSLLGHKGDLMLIHFRESFEQLNDAEMKLARLPLSDYLEPSNSYLSIVELGLYESTAKTYASLGERGIAPFSPEWDAAIEETLDRQRAAMKPRLYPEIPKTKYACFYPMDRRRGETKNWYQLPMAERQRQMQEHGMIGRRYAGEVRQIISGSIGFDDWEWGVDLFAEDPLVFKKLIYEMRFDEVSAVYAAFGSFFVGIRKTASELAGLLRVAD